MREAGQGFAKSLPPALQRRLGGMRVGSSINQRIFRAAMVLGAASICAKLITAGRELVAANYFGRGDLIEAYLMALFLPNFLVAMVANSLNTAFIPALIAVRDGQGKEAAQRLFSSVMCWSGGVMAGLALALALLGRVIFHVVAASFSGAKFELTVHIFYVLLPVVILSGTVTLWGATLNASERFAIPALTSMSAPAGAILGLLIFGQSFGVWPLAVGTLAGSAVELGILAVTLKKQGYRLAPGWFGLTPEMRQVSQQWAPMLVGGFLSSGINLVDQSMAAMLGAGNVSALIYGTRVVSFLTTVFAFTISTAILPYFSGMVARQDYKACRHTLNTYSKLVACAATPIAILLMVLSPMLIRVIFERGAFQVADTRIVSRVQAMYAIQIPFFAVSMLYVRSITACKRNDLLLRSAALNLTLDVVFNLLCARYLGIAGIALSTSLFYAGSFFFLRYYAYKLLRQGEAGIAVTLDPMEATHG